MQTGENIITKEGLKNLDNYQYHSSGYTWLDTKMNVLWQFLATLLPKWMAPNLITFIGWIFMILSYVIMLVHDYTLKKYIPSYCFYLAALFIFLYQTLDAMDGKQARNVKASSALGQLFDHGCDSFSMSFFALAIFQATRISQTEMFCAFVAAQLGFFTVNWVQYHTGVLNTRVGHIGVTEFQFGGIIIHLLTAIYGQDFWYIKVQDVIPVFIQKNNPQLKWLMETQLKSIIVAVFLVFAIINLLYFYFSILKTTKSNKFQVTLQFLPLYMLIGMEFIWYRYLSMYQDNAALVLVNFGILLSFIVCKMIICSVTQMKFQYLHRQIIFFIFSTIIIFFIEHIGLYFNMPQKSIQNLAAWIFWVFFLVNLYSILNFLVKTINQISQHLGIYCFSLQKRPKKQD